MPLHSNDRKAHHYRGPNRCNWSCSTTILADRADRVVARVDPPMSRDGWG